MFTFLHILAITTPIFALIGIGYVSTRFGLFARSDMRVLGKFVLMLALPALIFRALTQRSLAEVFNPTYLAAYLVGSLGALWLAYDVARRMLHHGHVTATFSAMGASCSNSGFVGYPILLLALPDIAGVVLALNMVVENLAVIPLLLFMAEHGKEQHPDPIQALRAALLRLVRNPMVLGLLAGLAVSVSGWTLPAPVVRTVDMLALASGAVSLVVIGGTLVGLPLRGLVWTVAPLPLAKLVLHPLLVWAAWTLLVGVGLPAASDHLRTAAILSAAMPMMGMFPTLAQAHGQDDWSAVALVLTTITAFFTLTGLLWLLVGG